MSQKFDLFDLMMHAEVAQGMLETHHKEPLDIEMLSRRLWAVIYIAQDIKGWNRPENFDEVMSFPEDNLED